jgi:hypothetical protein
MPIENACAPLGSARQSREIKRIRERRTVAFDIGGREELRSVKEWIGVS